jgi:hypothetical protein
VGVDKDNGTVTVNTDNGNKIELQANNALLNRLAEGDRVEVGLRKLHATSQQSRSGQPGGTSEQQAH